MSGGRIPKTELANLFETLSASDPERRSQAMATVRTLTSDQIVDLVRIALTRERRSCRNILTVCVSGAIALIALLSECTLSLQISGFLTFAAFVGVYLRLADSEISRLYWRQDDNIFRILEHSAEGRSVEAVLMLLESAQFTRRDRLYRFLFFRFASIRQLLWRKHFPRLHRILLQQLPLLRADDVREWTRQQKEQITYLLRVWYRHEDLAHGILRVLPEIGGAWALPTVELLAKLERWEPEYLGDNMLWTSDRFHRRIEDGILGLDEVKIEEAVTNGCRIRVTAAECLPRLRERAENEEASRVLLRAADARPQKEELLRAAADHEAGIDTTSLLRPSTPSEEITLAHRQ
ncbi:MAG: hypothetical protein JWN14_4842 [Chthonomonadales bacterium]|nr:hypothetical protein [Chthonomonadales bacterium]